MRGALIETSGNWIASQRRWCDRLMADRFLLAPPLQSTSWFTPFPALDYLRPAPQPESTGSLAGVVRFFKNCKNYIRADPTGACGAAIYFVERTRRRMRVRELAARRAVAIPTRRRTAEFGLPRIRASA